MPQIVKTIPNELRPDATYALRIRSINAFGATSDWSETTIIDTSPAGLLGAGRLVIGANSMTAYDNNGQMTFNYSSQNVVRTNKVTNPSFESAAVGTTGWIAESNTTISRVTSDFFVGQPGLLACLKVLAITDGIAGVSTTIADAVRRIAVSPGTSYTGSIYVKVPTGQPDVDLRISFRFYTIIGTLIKQVDTTRLSVITSSSKWVRLNMVAQIAPSGAAYMSIVIKSLAQMHAGSFWYLDGVMVEATGILQDYFDGSTSAGTSSWTGVINDSTSTLDNNSIYSVNGGVFTSPTLQTSRTASTTGGVVINSTGLFGYNTSGTATFTLSATLARLDVGKVQVGQNIVSSTDLNGIAIENDSFNNAWLRRGPLASFAPNTNYFRVGDSTRSIYMDSAGSGTYALTWPNFSIDSSGNMTSVNGKITVNAVQLGVNVGPSAGHDGLVLTSSDFNNIFIRRQSDGVVFFRINQGGANSLTYDSSSGVLNISGAISGGTIDIGGFDSTSFHVDTGGNMWMGAGSFGSAPFRVFSTGVLQLIGSDTYLQLSTSGTIARIDFLANGSFLTGGFIGGNVPIAIQPASSFEVQIVGTANPAIVVTSSTANLTTPSSGSYGFGCVNGGTLTIHSVGIQQSGYWVFQMEVGQNTISSNYYDSSIWIDPGFHFGNRAALGFHPGAVAGSITMLAGNASFNFLDIPGTGYYPIFGGAYTNASSIRFKQDVEQWPPPAAGSLSAASKKVLASERLRDLEVVSFRIKKEQFLAETFATERREKALARLNAYKTKMNQSLYPRPIHQCSESTCVGTLDNPCAWVKNWNQAEIGVVIEQVEPILPELVSYNESGDPIGLNLGSAIGFLLAVSKEIEQRLADIEAIIPTGTGIVQELPVSEISSDVFDMATPNAFIQDVIPFLDDK